MNADAVLLANGSVRIKRTRHGLMAYNINDLFVGRSLDCYGEYSQGETQALCTTRRARRMRPRRRRQYRRADAFARPDRRAARRRVAIEPQRAVYQLLCANLALNEIGNVRAIQAAAGSEAGQAFVPVTDHSKPGNFGGIELSSEGGERVDVLTVDSLQLPACQFIKIDVEGREQSVIAGATQTIARFRPALYVENDRRHQSADLIRQIREFGYTCYWHLPPLYRPDNFYRNRTNVFPGIVSIDMLCLPSGDTRKVEGMRPVMGPDDWPLAN